METIVKMEPLDVLVPFVEASLAPLKTGQSCLDDDPGSIERTSSAADGRTDSPSLMWIKQEEEPCRSPRPAVKECHVLLEDFRLVTRASGRETWDRQTLALLGWSSSEAAEPLRDVVGLPGTSKRRSTRAFKGLKIKDESPPPVTACMRGLDPVRRGASVRRRTRSRRRAPEKEARGTPPSRVKEEVGPAHDEDVYECDECKLQLRQKKQFKKHLKVHIHKEKFHCKVCNRGFSHISQLAQHNVIHISEKLYKCDICNQRLATLDMLDRHKKEHTRDKPFMCDICSRQFPKLIGLTNHLRVHTGDKPFPCGECGKRFALSSNLVIHERIHRGDRPYQCGMCNKRFTTCGHLTLHVRMHMGVKPFKCDLCPRQFTQSSNLTVHKRTHTGEKPFKCDRCNKRFSQSSSLATHMFTQFCGPEECYE